MVLRIRGAFTAPELIVNWEHIEIPEDYDKDSGWADSYIDEYIAIRDEFLGKYDLDDYAIHYNENKMGKDELKCIAYIHKNEIDKAKEFAKEFVEMDESGHFINGDEGFWERVLEIY